MSHAVHEEKPNVSSSSALWAALIFVGLLLAAVNFIQAQGHSDDGHGAATEHHDGGHGDNDHGSHGAAAAHGTEDAHGETHAAHATDSTQAAETHATDTNKHAEPAAHH